MGRIFGRKAWLIVGDVQRNNEDAHDVEYQDSKEYAVKIHLPVRSTY